MSVPEKEKVGMSDRNGHSERNKMRGKTVMKMNGARILVEELIHQGVRVVFGYPGGAVLDLSLIHI